MLLTTISNGAPPFFFYTVLLEQVQYSTTYNGCQEKDSQGAGSGSNREKNDYVIVKQDVIWYNSSKNISVWKGNPMQKKIGKAYELFLMGAILLITGLIVYTNLFHYCYRMNADIASEAVLARYIWESGEMFPKSWMPSTEYRILSSANLGALFYGVFQNMELAMGCASSILTFSVLGSLYFFVSPFSFRREEKLLFLLLCLTLPNHFMMLELFYLFDSYYAVHMILLFLTLGVYVRLLGSVRVPIIWLALLVLFSFIIGMQGMRGILVLNVPMFATETARQLWLWYQKSWKKRDGYIAGWCALLLLAGYAGTFAPFSVGQETTRNIRKGFAKLWETVLPQVFEASGFAGIEGVGRIVPVCFLMIAIGVLGGCMFCLLKIGGGANAAGLGVYSAVDVTGRHNGGSSLYNDRDFQKILFCDPSIDGFWIYLFPALC